jgi:hypothetical protein
MEAVIARVVEALVADVVGAVRAHESYKQLVRQLAEQSLAAAAAQAVKPADPAGPTSA